MRADRIWSGLRGGLRGLRAVILLASALVYVGSVLALWPWTRGLSRDIVGFALAPLYVIGRGLVANITNLTFLAVLFEFRCKPSSKTTSDERSHTREDLWRFQ